MLDHLKTHWRVYLFGALIVIFALWIRWWASWNFALEHQICDGADDPSDCSSYNIVFFSAWRFGKALDHWSTLITAAATIAIASFTFTLWRVTEGTLKTAIESVELAKKEFISTHRPKIRLRRIQPILPIKTNERVEALIEAANIGDTAATIFEIGVDIYIANQPFNARPVSVPAVLIEPGKQANLNVRGQRLSQSQIANMGAGPGLRMLGIINYRDDNGIIRTTSFARYYSSRFNRFIQVPDDDADKDRDYEN